ncbi:hypothetical protein L218DRAFT_951185 [Marasmius fiardii PR-910]|nr:hypothetical protein L218DRAFT_951185 [Marasmius fiardii PR-910]
MDSIVQSFQQFAGAVPFGWHLGLHQGPRSSQDMNTQWTFQQLRSRYAVSNTDFLNYGPSQIPPLFSSGYASTSLQRTEETPAGIIPNIVVEYHRPQVGSVAATHIAISNRKKAPAYFCQAPGCQSQGFTTWHNFQYTEGEKAGPADNNGFGMVSSAKTRRIKRKCTRNIHDGNSVILVVNLPRNFSLPDADEPGINKHKLVKSDQGWLPSCSTHSQISSPCNKLSPRLPLELHLAEGARSLRKTIKDRACRGSTDARPLATAQNILQTLGWADWGASRRPPGSKMDPAARGPAHTLYIGALGSDQHAAQELFSN